MERKRKYPAWLNDDDLDLPKKPQQHEEQEGEQTESNVVPQALPQEDKGAQERPMDATKQTANQKEAAAKTNYKKVMFPFALQRVGLLNLAMCYNCISRSRRRPALQFQDGSHYVNLYMCTACIVKNRALSGLLSQ